MKLKICSNVNRSHGANYLRNGDKEASKQPSTSMDTRKFDS